MGLVILSIFIYGAKPEQIASWKAQAMGMVGMRSAEYNLVAQMEPMEPLNAEDSAPAGASRA